MEQAVRNETPANFVERELTSLYYNYTLFRLLMLVD